MLLDELGLHYPPQFLGSFGRYSVVVSTQVLLRTIIITGQDGVCVLAAMMGGKVLGIVSSVLEYQLTKYKNARATVLAVASTQKRKCTCFSRDCAFFRYSGQVFVVIKSADSLSGNGEFGGPNKSEDETKPRVECAQVEVFVQIYRWMK